MFRYFENTDWTCEMDRSSFVGSLVLLPLHKFTSHPSSPWPVRGAIIHHRRISSALSLKWRRNRSVHSVILCMGKKGSALNLLLVKYRWNRHDITHLRLDISIGNLNSFVMLRYFNSFSGRFCRLFKIAQREGEVNEADVWESMKTCPTACLPSGCFAFFRAVVQSSKISCNQSLTQ